MQKIPFIFLITIGLAGCAGSSRVITDVAGGAGGAALAGALSDGDPLLTAVGAAGGIALSEGGHYMAGKEREKAAKQAYAKGQSDAIKQQYWLAQNLQKGDPNQKQVQYALIPVTVPSTNVNGINLTEQTHYIRVEENP